MSWPSIFVVLVPFTMGYLILLLPRATFDIVLDRYLIPLLGLFLLPLVRLFQEFVQSRSPALSFAVLAVFSAYSVAATHDYFATGRARLSAASAVYDSGVPRTSIQGGWEYDGWTQVGVAGYINDPRLQVPAGAYLNINHLNRFPDGCRFSFSSYTPAITPRFFVVFSPQSCLAPSRFPPVSYKTWLPPVHRWIYIQQAPDETN
jgi:hypothetical protein